MPWYFIPRVLKLSLLLLSLLTALLYITIISLKPLAPRKYPIFCLLFKTHLFRQS